VGAVQTSVMPYSFQRIEFGRVSWEIVDFDVFVMSGKPCPHISVFVVRSIVLNQIYFSRTIASHYSFEIHKVRFGIEDFLKMVEEPCTI
jgi:hypothetical protein